MGKPITGVTGFEDESTEDIQVDLHTRECGPPHLQDIKLMAEMREELFRRANVVKGLK